MKFGMYKFGRTVRYRQVSVATVSNGIPQQCQATKSLKLSPNAGKDLHQRSAVISTQHFKDAAVMPIRDPHTFQQKNVLDKGTEQEPIHIKFLNPHTFYQNTAKNSTLNNIKTKHQRFNLSQGMAWGRSWGKNQIFQDKVPGASPPLTLCTGEQVIAHPYPSHFSRPEVPGPSAYHSKRNAFAHRVIPLSINIISYANENLPHPS